MLPISAISAAGTQGAASVTAGMMQIAAPHAARAMLETGQGAGGAFQGILGQAMQKVEQLQSESSDRVRAFVTGEEDDVHSVMIAMEKSSLSLQLTMAVRNKIVDAYQEIMRMQI